MSITDFINYETEMHWIAGLLFRVMVIIMMYIIVTAGKGKNI